MTSLSSIGRKTTDVTAVGPLQAAGTESLDRSNYGARESGRRIEPFFIAPRRTRKFLAGAEVFLYKMEIRNVEKQNPTFCRRSTCGICES